MNEVVVAFDTGGTFTDFALQNERGEVEIWKRLSTPLDPPDAVRNGLTECWGEDLSKVAILLGSTTLVSNCVLERKGAATALVATAGHADFLEVGREIRYDLYDLTIDRPAPLVPRQWVVEAPERMAASGHILRALDTPGLDAICAAVGRLPVAAVAVCLLHAYRNPEHEQRIAEALRRVCPGLAISLSSEVAPEIREYERASTTVINAYVQPVIRGYVGGLRDGFRARHFGGSFLMMGSHGGLLDTETAVQVPVRLMESGPAAGALAASQIARDTSESRVLSFDMGGTTAKLCLVCDGAPAVGSDSEVAQVYRFKRGSGLPVKVPMLQMIEIGAGGGSIAGINHLGLLQVGPESAGANPGPACYGLGGHEPTVTDADLVLGYLDPDYFLGGRMRLDAKRAADGVMQHVGRVADLSLDRAAWGIHDLVNENMAGAARVHIVENAFDPRDFTLVAFGGAGPVHACGVAEKLGIRRMIVPPLAGVLSSLGLLAAPPGVELARSYPISLGDVGWNNVDLLFAEMREYGLRLLAAAGVPVDAVTFRRRVDMRYAGQGFEVGVDMGVDVADWKALGEAFENTYRTLFGRTIRDVDVEAVTWRLGLAGSVRRLGLPRWDRSGPIRKGERAIFVPGRGHISVPVYDRYALRPGDQVAGPAVVEEAESTVVAWARSRLTVDDRLNLIVDLGDMA